MDAVALAAIPLFASLSRAAREQVARLADEVDVPPGKVLAEEGRFAYEFFVILEGTAEVTAGGQRLRELGPGEFFGEIGLLESERRTATVTATTRMRLGVLFGPDLRQLDDAFPELALELRAAIRERLAG